MNNPENTPADDDPSQPSILRFGLRDMLAAIALIGLVLAPFANFGADAFGPVLIFGLLTVFGVGLYLASGHPASKVFTVFGLLLLAGLMAALMFPSVGSNRLPPGSFCRNNVRSMRTALENYAEQNHDQYPRASVSGPDGRPWHSWRVAILPYFGEQGRYGDYSWLEPWDGPNNRLLAQDWPSGFCCTEERKTSAHTTTLVLVTGPGSAWGEGPPPSRARLEKLPPDTIVMIEAKNTGIHWMEPRDLTIDEIMNFVETKGLRRMAPHNVLNVLCARGYVDQIDLSIDRESLRRRLTAADD